MAADSDEMQRALDALEHELNQRAPKLHQLLRPGLSDAAIDRILRPFPHSASDQLRLFYRWHDGTELEEGWRALLFPGARWLPLADAVKTWADAQEGDRRTGKALWDPRWLPIFTDGSDGFEVVLCGDGGGRLVRFFFVDLPDTWSEFNDLHSLVQALTRRWRSGAYWRTDDGDVEEDYRAVAADRRSADAQTPDVDQLIGALDGGSPERYGEALGVLRLRLYPEAVAGLIRLLQTGSDSGRRAAAELLGLIGDRTAVKALQRAASMDPNEIVRGLASNSLKELDNTSTS